MVVRVLEAQQDTDWSLPSSGLQARFSFDRGPLSNGTRLTTVFLELRNTSDSSDPIYLFYYPDRSIRAQLYNLSGNPVSSSPSAASIWYPSPFLLCLPRNSTLRLDVTAIGYGVPKDKKTMIGLASGVWLIDKADSSEYLLGGTLMAEKPTEAVKYRIWSGRLDIPRAKVTF
jgi:hypothetical protein